MKLNSIGYLIKSGFKGIFSHGLMSFATVAIIMACLIIMGCFALLVVNINDMIAGLEDESNVVVAFIDENLSREEAVALEPVIMAVPNVDSAQFVTREEAAEDFKSDYDPEIFDVLTDDTFRDRYVVQLQDISLMEQTRTDLYAVDGVAKVNAHLEYAEGFITARNIVSIISLILIVILIVVSFFIMTNTIKLATFTRREEIAIMKMVGASNGFIRCPFIVEGLILDCWEADWPSWPSGGCTASWRASSWEGSRGRSSLWCRSPRSAGRCWRPSWRWACWLACSEAPAPYAIT